MHKAYLSLCISEICRVLQENKDAFLNVKKNKKFALSWPIFVYLQSKTKKISIQSRS